MLPHVKRGLSRRKLLINSATWKAWGGGGFERNHPNSQDGLGSV